MRDAAEFSVGRGSRVRAAATTETAPVATAARAAPGRALPPLNASVPTAVVIAPTAIPATLSARRLPSRFIIMFIAARDTEPAVMTATGAFNELLGAVESTGSPT